MQAAIIGGIGLLFVLGIIWQSRRAYTRYMQRVTEAEQYLKTLFATYKEQGFPAPTKPELGKLADALDLLDEEAKLDDLPKDVYEWTRNAVDLGQYTE